METKLDKQRMEKVRRSCCFMNGIDVEAEGSRGGLFLAWRCDIVVSLKRIILMSRLKKKRMKNNGDSRGSMNVSWNLLRKLGQDKNHPWLLSGDFYEIMYSFEKSRGIPREERRMEAFREALEECQLEYLGYSGVWFTWERGNLPETNIRERLDRGVVNDKWRHLFPTGNIQHLPHSMSDHCPLLLNTISGNTYVGNPKFKFEAWWIMKKTFEKEIKASWESITGTIVEKLERLQVDLKVWARSIKKGRDGLKNKLTEELDMQMAEEKTDKMMAKIVDTKIYMNVEMDKDEVYWEQRARANWLKVGEKKSTFFHRFASFQRRINTISRLELAGGGEANEVSEINEAATLYFQKLFTSSRVGDLSYLLTGIENNISPVINIALLSTYTSEEVYAALKGMRPTKAPGPNGFQALFFQRYWHIIGEEVTIFCLGILNNDHSFGPFNQTDIVLIPKTPNPTSLVNFGPIGLCSIIYKVVAKTIANRLQVVIRRCIDATQSAFVPGSLISDNVLLAYEILHTFQQKRTGKK
ncbi:reverse transcriptase [Gossypium australe]|uniref:Reverse transcriptase n=1 Tax=Gossypium australe TaxID=47621 RepID=A0A5B6V0W1_9ROSI|nr:reverse transcriptase [Gossypium australe]